MIEIYVFAANALVATGVVIGVTEVASLGSTAGATSWLTGSDVMTVRPHQR
jgi:hypothetical protein